MTVERLLICFANSSSRTLDTGCQMRLNRSYIIRLSQWKVFSIAVLLAWVAFVSSSQAQSLDVVYKKAVKEGVVSFYGTLAQVNAEKILPVFEKRFPGLKVNQLDITSDQLVMRAVTEARAGKTLGDIFQAPLKTVMQMRDQK